MYLFGTSGIRRIFGKDLIYLALRVGLAVGEIYMTVSSLAVIPGLLAVA
jgi:hypothetical protein